MFDFYKKNQIDVFVNVSDAEGVPVSIMEALSCHIPVVATDVGGVSDMVIHGENGLLLPYKVSIEEIANALFQIELFKSEIIRDNAYELFVKRYNAVNNYPQFIRELYQLSLENMVQEDTFEK